MTEKKASAETTHDTADLLLDVAERLYAERGYDAVSLREINRAAGQKNASALHYHFGSREALFERLLTRRLAAIEAERQPMLKAAAADGLLDDVPTLVRALVAPFAAQVNLGGGDSFIGFVAQTYDSAAADLSLTAHAAHDASLRALARHLRAALGGFQPALARQRVVVVVGQVLHTLSALERAALTRGNAPGAAAYTRTVDNLVDMAVGALLAPVNAMAGSGASDSRRRQRAK